MEQVRHKIRQRVKDNDAKLVRLLKARNNREARIEAKAIERAEIDERKRIRAIVVRQHGSSPSRGVIHVMHGERTTTTA